MGGIQAAPRRAEAVEIYDYFSDRTGADHILWVAYRFLIFCTRSSLVDVPQCSRAMSADGHAGARFLLTPSVLCVPPLL